MKLRALLGLLRISKLLTAPKIYQRVVSMSLRQLRPNFLLIRLSHSMLYSASTHKSAYMDQLSPIRGKI